MKRLREYDMSKYNHDGSVTLKSDKNSTGIKKIKVTKKDKCPGCGTVNRPVSLIKVKDSEGRVITVKGRKCLCGQCYLTKKQYNDLSCKDLYEILEDKIINENNKTQCKTRNVNRCSKCGKEGIFFK